jgi:protein TonB
MVHDIDLTSPQWTSLIFEGKNKEYGAYEMRNDSSNRHLKALIIVTVVGLAAVYLPNLIKSDVPKKVSYGITTVVDISDLNVNKAKDENIVKVRYELPAVSLKPLVTFVPPRVVPDDMVNPDERMATQNELTESKAQIADVTVIGTEGGTEVLPPDPIAPPVAKEIPVFVEQMPQFPGGADEMMSWLSNNIHYPAIASDKNIQGRVVLRFVVRPDGSIDNVEIVKSLEPSCDKEAIRAVKSMPKWIPGRQNGNPVSVYYNLPITFRLQNSYSNGY